MARIKNMGTATMKFSEGAIVTGNTAHGNGYSSDYALVVTGSQFIDAEGGGGLTIFKKEPDTAFLRFINDDDPSSWYASFAFDQAENIYLSPGRSQDFFLKTRTNVGSDPQKFPFRIYDDGKAKFEHGQSDTAAAAEARSTALCVDGERGLFAKKFVDSRSNIFVIHDAVVRFVTRHSKDDASHVGQLQRDGPLLGTEEV